MDVYAALTQVRDCPFVLDAMRAAVALGDAVASGDADDIGMLSDAIADESDELTAVAALRALARARNGQGDEVLSELLSADRPFIREHAAWALAARRPRLDAIDRPTAMVGSGGFPGMLAQRTVQQWSQARPDHVALSLEGALAAHSDPSARARLVETMGLVPGPLAARVVRAAAIDPDEDVRVRSAAVAALGDRSADAYGHSIVRQLSAEPGELGVVARLAGIDLGTTSRRPGTPRRGLTVAQLFLHADLDHELSRAGTGDNGGIATLLVRLGDALAAQSGVASVLTLSRGSAQAALDSMDSSAGGHRLEPVPLLPAAAGMAEAWPARIAATRGIRRVLRAHPVDVVHLRMADVGSLAAAEVAGALGIPFVFTLAPDPHAIIHGLDMDGGLTRANFGTVDQREHFWFRAELVRTLTDTAARAVLFPRPHLREDLLDLLGVDITTEPNRYTVVPEGIDLAVSASAEAEVRRDSGSPAVQELNALVAALPEHRRGLPLALSVGRLHRVKGMAGVVQAWASDAGVHQHCNLVIVGGDLNRPSRDEQEQLDRIAELALTYPHIAEGMILTGHRTNDVVARWLAAAVQGSGSGSGAMIGAGGIYVCGSVKEEFGLALLEALAAGLVVVGPDGGGPATYIENGITGFLVDTRVPERIGVGMGAALFLAASANRRARILRAREVVRANFTIEAMASTLGGVYSGIRQDAIR